MMGRRFRTTIGLAVGFGLASGLAEGLLFLLFQRLQWLNWSSQSTPVDANILWAAPIMNLVLFVLIGLILWLALGWVRRIPWTASIIGLFATLTAYDLLVETGRILRPSVALLSIGIGTVVYRWVRRDVETRAAVVGRALKPIAVLAGVLSLAVVPGGAIWERYQLWRLPEPSPNTPNVLLIVLDTVRADRFGSYGYDRLTTPFLDRLAGQGVRYENAIAPSSWTLPSHATLFTGRFPYEHGAMLNVPLSTRFPTLAEVLAARGYATVGIASNNGMLSKGFGLARGFIHCENEFFSLFDSARRTVFGREIEHRLDGTVDHDPRLDRLQAPEVNARFLAWVDSHPGRRFFAFLNYMETHETRLPPFEVARRFSPTPEAISAPYTPAVSWARHAPRPDRQQLSDAYDASLAYLDSQLEILFDRLRSRNLDRDLLVVITSDHGESLGERGIFQHRSSLYDEQIRVPLFIRFPGRIAAQSLVARPVSLRDVPATILSVAVGDESALPGRSLLRLLTDDRAEMSPIWSELEGTPYPGVNKAWPVAQGWVKSVVTDQWHFILQQNGKTELFPWLGHVLDGTNAAADPSHRELVSSFRDELLKLQVMAHRH
jgi:arylsulfatase A-like enzyme